jgi:16S rRNA G966 N2-methylase RsmD
VQPDAPHDQRTTWPVHPAAELFPLLADDELRELAEDIRANGLHEPVWLYDDPLRGVVLLDGRNRSRACQLAGVEITTRWYDGDNPIAFVWSENVKRRHLSAGQQSAIADELGALAESEDAALAAKARAAGERNRQEAAKARRRAWEESLMANTADLPEFAPVRTPADTAAPSEKPAPVHARERFAAAAGISSRSADQYKRIKTKAPDLIPKLKSNELSLKRAERIVRDRDAEQRRVDEARAAAAAAEVETLTDIRHGDFREVLADLTDVDAIITDPPYPAEYLPLLDDLAAWADKVLTPDGVLVILFGQTYLPEVYRRLDGHRPYRWTGCYLTPGAGYVSMARHVQSNWKPLLVYGGGPRFSDTLSTEGQDAGAKSLHKWGQDYAAFHTLIERFTKPGQTVVDPFAGSGTTLLAAKALGRHAIGAELDHEHVRTARERVA